MAVKAVASRMNTFFRFLHGNYFYSVPLSGPAFVRIVRCAWATTSSGRLKRQNLERCAAWHYYCNTSLVCLRTNNQLSICNECWSAFELRLQMRLGRAAFGNLWWAFRWRHIHCPASRDKYCLLYTYLWRYCMSKSVIDFLPSTFCGNVSTQLIIANRILSWITYALYMATILGNAQAFHGVFEGGIVYFTYGTYLLLQLAS